MKTKYFPDNWRWIETDDLFLAWNPTENINKVLDLILKICEELGDYKSSENSLDGESPT